MSLKFRLLFSVLCLIALSSVSFFLAKRQGWFTAQTTLRPQPLQSVFTSKGVSNRILRVHLYSDKVNTNAEEVEVKATISMPFDYNGVLNFKWKLGEGVSADNNYLQGQLENLRAGEEQSVTLKVKGFSLQENHHVGFEIIGTLNGRRIHGDSLLASDMENTFENTVQNVERIKSEQ